MQGFTGIAEELSLKSIDLGKIKPTGPGGRGGGQ